MKVSVITVSYNSAKTIERTIQSVLGQSYLNIEYIIIDGASTDGTVDIICRYADKLAYWVSEPDQGIYDAMNKGIRIASGDVIGIINSDDWYSENAVQLAVEYFIQHDVGWVHGDIVHIDTEGKEIIVKGIRDKDQIYFDHPTMFTKKYIYEQFGMYDLRYKISADLDFMLRLREQMIPVGYIPHIMAYYRLTGVSSVCCLKNFHDLCKIVASHQGKPMLDSLKWFDCSYLEQEKRNLFRKYLCHRLMRLSQNIKKQYYLAVLNKYNKSIIAFWGAGKIGEQAITDFRDCDWPIEAVVDKSSSKQKTGLMGVPVHAPAWLQGKDVLLILTVGQELLPEVKTKAAKCGYRYGVDCLSYIDSDFQEEINRLYVAERLSIVHRAARHVW